jgi:hypothetical protein
VKVKVDEITRPGAMVSGSVVFTDGKKAGWYLDQTGRLGMVTEEPGYAHRRLMWRSSRSRSSRSSCGWGCNCSLEQALGRWLAG